MKYELIYIIDTALEEEARNELIARFSGMIESNGGTVDKVEEWGKRRLAYLVDDKPEGYYVLVAYTAEPTLPREIERNLGITEGVLRYLTTRVDVKRSNVKPRPQRIQPVAQPRQDEPEAEEAPDTPADEE